MTKTIMNSSAAKVLGSLFLSATLFFHASASNAQVATTTGKTDDASAASVTFIGSQDGDYIFDVQFDNASGDSYYVAVVDDSGNTLFKGLYSDKKFDKKFKLPAGEEINKVSFVIRNIRSKNVYTYAVAAKERQVEEVSVERKD
jgi:hypothetical protein